MALRLRTSDDPRSVVTRHAGGAVVLAVVVALAFWFVGALRGPGDAGGGALTGGQAGDDPAADGGRGRDATPQAEAADPGRAARAAISVQVLDAVFDPGAATATGLADRVGADGYDLVVVRTAARPYGVTTVYFTPGHRSDAELLAGDYDVDEVARKPDSLSDTVDVHLVVGDDRLD